MNCNWKCATVAIAMLVSMTAHAQTPPVAPAQQTSTVGNVLDQGGKKLTKDEATALVTGKVVSGVQGGDFKDVTFTNTYAADGTVMGNAWRSGKWFSKIKGKWWIDQSGQFCQDLLNDRQEKIASCQALYVVGASYYSARGDGRSAEVTWRTFSQ